jgi:DNA-binding LacI/PurR family transcriptional regulator
MITIKHIAERLDLSVSTVGRALTDHPRISRETKDRVNLVAKELGYIANTAARVMRGGSSHLIGLLVPDIHSSFYSTVAQALSKQFEGRGFHLALSIAEDNRDTEMQQVRELLSARVAGIIIIPTAAPRRETLSLLKMVPHVQILRRVPALGDWFGMDDEHALEDATNHLFELGHRRVAFIGDTIFPTGKARYSGFRKAHSRAGVTLDEELVALGTPDSRFGEEAAMRLMAKKPTAIITSSVLTTLGAADRLMALKVSVPQTLSVVGFGDGPWQKLWGPGLTTLQLPAETIGAECGRWFLQQLRTNRPAGVEKAHAVVSKMSLIVRGSTAPPRA